MCTLRRSVARSVGESGRLCPRCRKEPRVLSVLHAQPAAFLLLGPRLQGRARLDRLTDVDVVALGIAHGGLPHPVVGVVLEGGGQLLPATLDRGDELIHPLRRRR